MLYLAKTTDLPIGTNYRVLAYDCAFWDHLSLIETVQTIPGLRIAPDTYPNGVSTDPIGCIAPWEVIEAPVLPDLDQSVDNMNINAFVRPVETMKKLLEKSTIDNAVNLYNSDGIQRVEKVGE